MIRYSVNAALDSVRWNVGASSQVLYLSRGKYLVVNFLLVTCFFQEIFHLNTFLFFSFLYSHKIYNDKQLQYKSKGSMEIHDNPKTYTERRDINIAEIVTQYLATKG